MARTALYPHDPWLNTKERMIVMLARCVAIIAEMHPKSFPVSDPVVDNLPDFERGIIFGMEVMIGLVTDPNTPRRPTESAELGHKVYINWIDEMEKQDKEMEK